MANQPTIDLATDQADVTILGPRNCGSFAGFIALADVDGDGFDDLLIADSAALLASASGAVYVQRGQDGIASGTVINWRDSANPDLTVFLNHASYQLTGDFAVGDYDGDGINDLAIAGLDYWEPSGRGVVHLLRGPVFGNGATRDLAAVPADLTINGRRGSAYSFGEALAFDDLNQDGRADLVVGHPYLVNADTKGAVFLFFGAELADQPAEWDLAETPADVKVESGSDARFQMLGLSLLVGDYNDDGAADLVIADSSFGANGQGALFFVDASRLGKGKVINLTAAPADLTIIGPTDSMNYGTNFNGVTLAGPTLESGSSLWFANPDAGDETSISGEAWQLTQDQLTEGAVLFLDEIVPASLFTGIANAGFGRDLLIAQLDDNDQRDFAVTANFLLLPGDEGKCRGAAFVYLDQLSAPPPTDDDVDDDVVDDDAIDDDTADDDDVNDDDSSSADDDDDNDEASCGC